MAYKYLLTITPETRAALAALAQQTGHIVTQPGPQHGGGSLPDLLTALANAYAADPNRVARAIGAMTNPPNPPAEM